MAASNIPPAGADPAPPSPIIAPRSRTIGPVSEDGGDAGKARMEEFEVIGPEGGRVKVRRNMDTGEQTITGDAMQRGDRPGVYDELSLRVVKGEVPKDNFPPPMPEVVDPPVVVGTSDDPAREVLPVNHTDVATPAEVKRRSRQAGRK